MKSRSQSILLVIGIVVVGGLVFALGESVDATRRNASGAAETASIGEIRVEAARFDKQRMTRQPTTEETNIGGVAGEREQRESRR
ncbi:MAG: hypothetical protein QM820_10600 [Minicystis sp.]